MAGGGAASAGVGEGATVREWRNGERGTEQKLTADSAALTESSGMHWRRRGGDEDLPWPGMKTMSMEALQGLPRRVDWRRGSRRRGGASGHDGGARDRQ